MPWSVTLRLCHKHVRPSLVPYPVDPRNSPHTRTQPFTTAATCAALTSTPRAFTIGATS